MNGIGGTKASLSGKSLACVALSLFGLSWLAANAQVTPKPPVSTPSAGGNSFDGPGAVRYQPGRDSQQRRIDMFIGDWRDSLPRHAFGSLVLRDILTRGDNYAPPQPGAILQAANFLAFGRLRGWIVNKSSFILSPAPGKSSLEARLPRYIKTSLSSFRQISNSS
jgi:hypothetical protein